VGGFVRIRLHKEFYWRENMMAEQMSQELNEVKYM
jgi:hypothetical protein